MVLRVHNLNDGESKTIKLHADGVSPILTAFYGNKVQISLVKERSLGNNMDYQ